MQAMKKEEAKDVEQTTSGLLLRKGLCMYIPEIRVFGRGSSSRQTFLRACVTQVLESPRRGSCRGILLRSYRDSAWRASCNETSRAPPGCGVAVRGTGGKGHPRGRKSASLRALERPWRRGRRRSYSRRRWGFPTCRLLESSFGEENVFLEAFCSSSSAFCLAMLASRLETESGSELELVQRQSWRHVKKTLGVAGVLLAVVCVASMRFNNQCVNLDALQGKSEVEVDSAILKATNKLLKVKNRSIAQSTVVKAMAKAGQDVQEKWEEHHLRKLDALAVLKTKREIDEYNQGEKNEIATNVECSFNVLEAFVSVVGMGDDINGIIRTCPPPRDGESELACQAGSWNIWRSRQI